MFLRNLAILQALQQPLQSTISIFSVSLESTFPSCATLGILLYLILSHSRDTQTHINFPNPCWIKSAHRSAFVLTCPPFYSDSFILCSFNISSFYKHFHRKNTSQSTMSTFSLYHFQGFSISCHFRHFPSSFHSHNRDIQTLINLVQILLICTRPCAIPCTLSHPTLFS